MKRNLKIPTVFLILCLSIISCVDNDYDLTDINTDNITIGGENLVIPMGRIEIDLGQLLTKASQTINFPVNDAYDLGNDGFFDESILDKLPNDGNFTLVSVVSNPIGETLSLRLWFDYRSGDGSSQTHSQYVLGDVSNTVRVNAAGETTVTINVTRDMLEHFCKAVDVGFYIGCEKSSVIVDDSNLKMTIQLTVKAKGGIEL